RAAEFFRLLHQPDRLAVALRPRHTEVIGQIFLQGPALPVSDHRDGPPVIEGDPPQDTGVLPALPVAPLLKEIGEQCGNIVRRPRPRSLPGEGHPLGRGQLVTHGATPPFRGAGAAGSASPAWRSGGRSGPQSRAPPDIPPAGTPRAGSGRWSAGSPAGP